MNNFLSPTKANAPGNGCVTPRMRLYKLIASLLKSKKPSFGLRRGNLVALLLSCGVKLTIPASILFKLSCTIFPAITLTFLNTSIDVSVNAISKLRWSTISPSSAFSVIKCNVAPVYFSPFTTAQFTHVCPRYFGKSAPCKL